MWRGASRPVACGRLSVLVLVLALALVSACGPPGQVTSAPETSPDTAPSAANADLTPSAAVAAGADDPSVIPGLEPAAEPGSVPLIATPAASAQPPAVDALGPYFAEEPLRGALAKYLAGDNAAAALDFGGFALIGAPPTDPRLRPARFMALLSRHDAGEHTPVATELEAFAVEAPELADYALHFAAAAHLAAGRWDAAIAAADRVPAASTLWGRARELRARAQLGAGHATAAAATLDQDAARAPGTLRPSAWALRARIATAARDKVATVAALVEQASRFPTTAEGRAALTALGKKPKLTAHQRFRLGEALTRAQRHNEALAMLDGLTRKDPGCPEAPARDHEAGARASGAAPTCHWCKARYLAARTHEKKKQPDAAWAQFQLALTCTEDAGVYADATFAAGRNRAKAGDRERAERLLGEHLRRFPGRSTADDALVMLADLARAAGDDAAADALLMRIVERHPGGDQVDQAAWDLVWPRIADGRYEDALALADQVLAIAPRETHYRAEGRVRYWRGRLLLGFGRAEEARADFTRVLTEFPLSWYALLAYARLVREDATAARETLAAIVADSPQAPDPLARIPERLWRDEHFRRGLELARMGLMSSAEREFQAVPGAPAGQAGAAPADTARPVAVAGAAPEPEPADEGSGTAPSGDEGETAAPEPEPEPEPVTAAAAPEALSWLWTKVALYHGAGAWHLGMRLARPQEPVFGATWPHGTNAPIWRLAHPRAFAPLVERWALTRGLEPAWVYAIAREESGFNPGVESWANAVGLMQIILPTAEMLARGTDIRPTRAALQDPAVALELGTKYLAKLLGEHRVIPLASAGYNAGGGSVRRWRREFGDRELDEFVERISYQEARGYAKRVTRSVARYLWLYAGRMLVLPLDPPGPPD